MTHAAPSPRTYRRVAVALFALLALTLLAAGLHLGAIALPVALLIAAAKAALVALYFMHLRYTGSLTRLFALAGLVWLAILIGLTMADVLARLAV